MKVLVLLLLPILPASLSAEVVAELRAAGPADQVGVLETLPARLKDAGKKDRENLARHLARLLANPERKRLHAACLPALVATDTTRGVRTVLSRAYGREPTILRAVSRQALAREGGSAVTSTLLAELRRDESPRARALVALFLGERGAATAGPGLLHALEDPSPMVRGAAAEALVRIYRVCRGYDPEDWKRVIVRGPPAQVPENEPQAPSNPEDPGTVTSAAPAKRLPVTELIGKLVPTFYGIPLDRKTVVVVFDFSSSVRRFGDGPARKALEEALSLLPSDRSFTVLAFDQRILPLETRPEPARPALKERLAIFLETLPPGQRTELLLPIRTGLAMATERAGEGAQLLIISDGAPTVSSSTLDDIIDRVEGLRGKKLRVDAAVYGGRDVGLFRYLTHRTGGRSVSIPNAR